MRTYSKDKSYHSKESNVLKIQNQIINYYIIIDNLELLEDS